MAVNFTAGQFLTAEFLNSAFASTLDLTQTHPQTMVGSLNLTTLNAAVAVTAEDLIVSGPVTFTSVGAVQLAGGTTLQRPTNPTFGMIRFNSDSGQLECRLGSGVWANFLTTAAASSPTNPPINQGGISFGQASSASVPLAWTAPGGGTAPFAYKIEYRLSGTSNWILWATNLPATSATVSGLLPATRYDFQVTSFNTAGQTTSPTASTNTLGFAAGGPSTISTFSPTSTTMSLAWTSVVSTVPVAYIVNYAAAGQSVWAQFATPTSDTSLTVTGLTPNQLYNFQIVAKTSGGSYESIVAQGTTAPAATVAPNAPTAITFGSITKSSVAVSWNPPTTGSGPFAYRIQYQINSGAFLNYKTPTTGTSMVMTNLISGQPYFIRVMAINSAGTSTSTASSVTPLTEIASVGNVAEFQNSGASFPVITGPLIGTIGTQSSINIAGLNVDDPAAAYSPGTMSIAITCGAGTITLTDQNGNKVVGSGTANIAATPMTLANVKQCLATLSYTAPAAATGDTITITIADQFAQTSKLLINMTVIATTGVPSPPPTPPPNSGGGTGLRTSTGQPTDTTGTQAGYVNLALGQFGVGLELDSAAYGPDFSPTTAAVIENAINYLGLGHINFLRTKVQASMLTPSFAPQFMSMIAQNCGGLRHVVTLDLANYPTQSWTSVLNAAGQFCNNYPQFSDSISGIWNAGGQLLDSNQIANAVQFQQNVYNVAQSVGVQSGAPTSYHSSTALTGAALYSDYGNWTMNPKSAPDFGSAHAPGGDLVYTAVQAEASARQPNYCNIEAVWNTFPDNGTPLAAAGYVAESAQAAYVLTYIWRNYLLSSYVPMSGSPTAGTGFACYGELFDNNGTNGLFNSFGGTPKLAAQAVRTSFQLLYDNSVNASNVVLGKLNYTVTGKPATPGGFTNGGYGDALFQRTDGMFILVMWNEQPLNNSSTNALLTVAPVNVTLTFNEQIANQVVVYDPLQPFSLAPAPVQSVNSVTSMTISLPAHPIYVCISHI